jgi:2-phosphosulfolactate phosphatase
MKIHLEWGTEALKIPADAVIVVDCLSFSTAVSVACTQGAHIYPYLFGNTAREFAQKLGVECAGKRAQNGYSLSPSSLGVLGRGQKLVLPSPNGSTLSLSAKADTVLAGCLRNARAIAAYLTDQQFDRVVFVAAGERWIADGSLRPAFEDLIACGAIIDQLTGDISPEAQAAKHAFAGIKNDLPAAMFACQSGIELTGGGWRDDVEWASMVSCDDVVPKLQGLPQTYEEIGIGGMDGFNGQVLTKNIGFYRAL